MNAPYTDYLDKTIDIGFTIRQGGGTDKKTGYMHRHSFYEALLVIDGAIELAMPDGSRIRAENNMMTFMCPGFVHATYATGLNIQLGISRKTMDEMMLFLFGEDYMEFKPIDIFRLSSSQTKYFLTQIRYASLFSPADKVREKAFLRKFIVTLITEMIFPMTVSSDIKIMMIPDWMSKLIESYQSFESLSEGVDYMKRNTGLSGEYICRSFKKYLGTTPVQFVASQKLNYAANMLIHSDQEISQICEDIGFSSLSHFYRKFKEAFQLTPAQYRKRKKLF